MSNIMNFADGTRAGDLNTGLYLPESGYGKEVPIASELRRQASQENCDGDPYDAMVFAAEYIDRQLSKVEGLEKELRRVRAVADYVLQDQFNNRLMPRVVDVAYTAFMKAKDKNDEDGGPTDWFTDTRPVVMKAIEKMREGILGGGEPAWAE